MDHCQNSLRSWPKVIFTLMISPATLNDTFHLSVYLRNPQVQCYPSSQLIAHEHWQSWRPGTSSRLLLDRQTGWLLPKHSQKYTTRLYGEQLITCNYLGCL
jgi:hypothetical protein